ncbi:hypothetical protein [Niastella vici]|uniref:hypothetical protein n=1 Tax=Niastella vici TaxID=1703345 RepID=UPI00117FCB1B|nr:hypothetical protein [Niastella vici]
MKPKFICILVILICASLAASPNRCCNGTGCTGKQATTVTTPAKVVTMMIDDVQLLPIHLFNNF